MKTLIIIQYQILNEKGNIENDSIAIEATEENLNLLQKLKDQNTQ
jgi:hypothetical protein